jgi:thiamine biosynthesis lipoprotein
LAVDVLCEYLDKQQIKNYYVEIGGELRVKGLNKEGAPWRIGIEVADENNSMQNSQRDLLTVIGIEERAVATSGNYRKFYEIHGKKRSHTIDPYTGYPVEHGLLSATVIAENTALADAMATVFMVWGTDKTITYLKNNPKLKLEILLQFVDEDNEIRLYMSPGFEKLLVN